MSRTSKALILAIVVCAAAALRAQQPWQQSSFLPLAYGMAAPVSNCSAGNMYVQAATSPSLWLCTAANTWSQLGFASGTGVPTGAYIFIDAGSCPTGYAEATALDGKTIIGTVAANGNVGTTGGADTITPAGSVAAPTFTGSSVSTSAISAGTPAGTNSAPAFTGSAWTPPAIAWPAGVPTHSGTAATFAGSALATHAHELPFQIVSATSHRLLAAATFGTGTSRAAAGAAAADTSNTTSAVVALSQAISAGTPAGTVTISNQGAVAWPAGVPTIGAFTPAGSVAAPSFSGSALGTHSHTDTAAGTNSAPAFTGTSFDNRSAFVRLIGCKKS